jgi:hypothetical protein
LNCFSHPDQSAVAICKNCGKAVCVACADDTGQGVACSSTCAADLLQRYQLEQRLKQNFGVGRNPPMPAVISTYTFFGLILLGVGLYLSYTRPGIDFLTLAMSAVFFVMAGASFKRYRDTCQSD